jgi:hypothetical protein
LVFIPRPQNFAVRSWSSNENRCSFAVNRSDVVITKLANSLRNIEISIFFLISITFQGAGAAESSRAVNSSSQ